MSARYLFDRIVAAGWDGLLRWEAEKEPETFQLEFKGRGHASPRLNEFDRVQAARGVSGFANTSGGVIVFGVETKKHEGVDRVERLDAAENVAAYAQAFNDHVRTCVVPDVPGAHAVAIPEPSAADRGVVAIYVPPSDGGPHRVVTNGDFKDRYFTRIGTSFHVLTHELLGAMFGRRPPPVLRLALTTEGREVFFHVVNRGRGLARDVHVSAEIMRVSPAEIARQAIDAFDPWRRSWRRPYPGSAPPTGVHFALIAPWVVHADDVQRIGKVDLPAADSVRVRGRIDADGMMPAQMSVEVRLSDSELTLVPAIGDDAT